MTITEQPIATFDLSTVEQAQAPAGIPESAWPSVFGAAAIARATGSVGAYTTDPSTGAEYRVTFRREVSDDQWKISRSTSVADVYSPSVCSGCGMVDDGVNSCNCEPR